MDGFVRTGDLASGQRMLQDMQACGLKPNTITFNILLRGICQCLDRPVEVPPLVFISLLVKHAAGIFCGVEESAGLAWLQWIMHRHAAPLRRGCSRS